MEHKSREYISARPQRQKSHISDVTSIIDGGEDVNLRPGPIQLWGERIYESIVD